MRLGSLRFAWACLACSANVPPAETQPTAPATASARPLSPEQRLTRAEAAFRGSRYVEALADFESLLGQPCCDARARLGRSEVQLVQGLYRESLETSRALTTPEVAARARIVAARAHLALGELERAEESLRSGIADPAFAPGQRRPWLVLLGELLIARGHREDAEAPLMQVIEEYNDDVVKDDDGPALLWVARAAQLLRSPEDANDAFNLAEKALGYDLDLLLARARLFLDNHDPGHAEEVVQDILEVAPHQPDALVLMAEVRLDQALDFGAAKDLVARALTVNPRHARAHYVLAGLSLRDMQLEAAFEHVGRGLLVNPTDLELLSMRAAVEFLADDAERFERTRREVLGRNPQYSRFYAVVGEYAEWEHRYDDIVSMMREAVAIDPEDAKALAQLGLNWIRSGDDARGVEALQRAFAKDPFNVRVHNTLNLYEKVIPSEYVTERAQEFTFRYPKLEQPIFSREIPVLMRTAWVDMTRSYDFVPETPIGVELYHDRQHFAVRTSGLPQIAIQGVCFGRTLASMSPRNEQFNLGMTLWHELAHVFHIQLSKSHVPRWFTEGLAEYETLAARPEWKRERDAELYRAVREGRLPKIGDLNEAFTHAESLEDVTVAYYASTQVVTMLVEQFGRAKLREMLRAWGEGKRHEAVFQAALGVTGAELDRRFVVFLKQRLGRFEGQYLPPERVGDLEPLRARLAESPKDPGLLAQLALAALQAGDEDEAELFIERALAVDPKHADVRWLKARLRLEQGKEAVALGLARALVQDGFDGYEVQALIARVVDAKADPTAFETALERAHAFDPERADPLFALLRLAVDRKDTAAELSWLRKLAPLVEHDGAVYRRLSELLLAGGEAGAALEAARAGVYADMQGGAAYVTLARALEGTGRAAEAEAAFESALRCPADNAALARHHDAFAEFQQRRGRAGAAEKLRRRARELTPGAP